MLKAVHNLWIVFVKAVGLCVKAVAKLWFMNNTSFTKIVSTQFLLTQYTVLVNNFFNKLTDVLGGFCTVSTELTKTIYLNKKEYI